MARRNSRLPLLLRFFQTAGGSALLTLAGALLFSDWAGAAGARALSSSRQESANARQSEKDVRALELGKLVERQLAGGESHTYQITLEAGQYLHVAVDQRGVDVIVKLFGPDEKLLAQSDLFRRGAENLLLVALATGAYQISVVADESPAVAGRYQALIRELRQATLADESRAGDSQTAGRLHAEARRLAKEKDREARLQAVTKYQEALPLWRLAGDQRAEAATLLKLGVTYDDLNDRRRTLECYQQALKLCEAASDRTLEGLALAGIGTTYLVMLQPLVGLPYLEKALPLVREGDDRALEAATLSGICGAYVLSDQQKTIECLDEALLKWRALGERYGEAQALRLLGVAHRLLGEPERATEYFNQANLILKAGAAPLGALSQSEKDQIAADQAFAQANLLAFGKSLADRRLAVEKYQESLHLWRALPKPVMEANSLNSLGILHHKLGETRQALDCLGQALKLWREMDNHYGEAVALAAIGEVYYSSGDQTSARERLDQAIPILRTVGDRNGILEPLYSIACLDRDNGQMAEARERIEEAIKLIEDQRAMVSGPEWRISYLASQQMFHEFHVDLLMRQHLQTPSARHDAAAFEANERRRARALIDLLVESRVEFRGELGDELRQKEHRLRQQLYAKHRILQEKLRGDHTQDEIKAINQGIAELLDRNHDLSAQIRRHSPRYAALIQPQPLSLAELQRHSLDDDTLLLEYALGEDHSYLWAVTPTTITSHELPKRAEVEEAARLVYELLTARNRGDCNETKEQEEARVAEAEARYPGAAARLSQMLLGPVAAQLGRKRLLIVADGMLQYLPFAALPLPETRRQGDGETRRKSARPVALSPRRPVAFTPLVVEHEIVSLPSASTIAVLRRETAGRKPASKALAVIADPVYDEKDERFSLSANLRSGSAAAASRKSSSCNGGKLSRLWHSGVEARSILALAPAGQRFEATGFKASRAAATSAELSQYRIVHFSLHGKADAERPDLSSLALSMMDENGKEQDGYLRAHEIYNLNLPAELVVLSACETGLGKNVRGEGLISLTRGFMYAGAKRVAVSLWEVNDAATSRLMARFYRGMLKRKLRPAAALRAAQIEMWRSPRLSSPFLWAGFALQGEWRE